MVNEEIDLVVAQFKILLGFGHEASLKLDCKLGEAWINLSCKVGRNAPPLPHTPLPACDVTRKNHRSPSYFRRQARRKSERESRAVTLNNVSLCMPKAEKVQDELTADEASKNVTIEESHNMDIAEKAIIKQVIDVATGESLGKVNRTQADEPACEEVQQHVLMNQHCTLRAQTDVAQRSTTLPIPKPPHFQTQPGTSCCDHICRPDPLEDPHYKECCRHRCRKPWT